MPRPQSQVFRQVHGPPESGIRSPEIFALETLTSNPRRRVPNRVPREGQPKTFI